MKNNNKIIKINANDNVVIATQALDIGDVIIVDDRELVIKEPIVVGHKIALIDIFENDNVIKYGAAIGRAQVNIAIGEHVHSHNLTTNLGDIHKYEYFPEVNSSPSIVKVEDRDVCIYRRDKGQVGIRNELWIVPTVTCVNSIADTIKKQFLAKHEDLKIDSVEVLRHPYGCSQLGEDHLNTRTILQDMVNHPNAGAVLVLGLGCENNQIKQFRDSLGEYDSNRVKFLICQQEDDEIESGLRVLDELYSVIKNDQRTLGKFSEIKLGLKCGGSDAFSGITANPLLGLLSDYMVDIGGTTVLTEVPEMFGAEQPLMNRAVSQEVFQDTVSMINNFKQYFIDHKQPIYENPSPGNKDGGITTLEEKSLGCTQKSGTRKVVDVLKYGERLTKPGLNLLSAPGNDAVATTALIAAGCHIVLFSTGRGTPYGGFAPTLKLSTNSELAAKKSHWIDFNAGELVAGATFESALTELIEMLVDVINGKRSVNELLDFKELAIFKTGVTL